MDAVLQRISRRISADGAHALPDADKLIWNTAIVIALMTGDTRIALPPGAEIGSWGAARAGLREMALPQAAELVRLLVLELAYRADLGGRDREAGMASLLRIADLKQRFQEIAAEVDITVKFRTMMEHLLERRS
ncbi:MAG TPA: hypothetical protein VN034_11230 [Sphingopyxis sp.]|nr:hypothetical protein [Sphingopyxis sp.]